MRQLIIDGKTINNDSDAYVICEIGHNHCGDIEICKQLFKVAKDCGADACKLQKRNNRKLFTKAMYNSPYDNPNSYGATYGEHREALEFGREEYVVLKECAADLGICFFATAFDIDSADFLADLEMPAYKIASWDLTNIPLIKHIAKFNKPMILSTGGATINDIFRACGAISHDDFAFLHCIASYPNQPEDMNLKIIETLRKVFLDTVIGHSDHYNGIVMAEAAYILGARIIEKHFTLNHTWKGTDHALSLEPQGMKRLCRDLKRLKVAMGDGVKRKLSSEEKAIWKMGNVIHPARTIPKGKIIEPDDICVKAPNDGLLPYDYKNVLGKIAINEISTSDTLTGEDLGDE